MTNLWQVIKREYVTRVRRKSFILATLLTPLGFGLFVIVAQFIFSYQNDDEVRIAVIDEADLLDGKLADRDGVYFTFVNESVEDLRDTIGKEGGYNGALLIPALNNSRQKNLRVQYISDETLTVNTELAIRRQVERGLREYKIETLGLDQSTVAALETDVDVRTKKLTVAEGEDADTSSATAIGTLMGSIMGFLMYISIFVYGMMVLRSVMEEKTNRIVEVVISSVRPTTLLMGKIIGVGALGLTQVLAWVILIPGVVILLSMFFGFDADAAQNMPQNPDIDPEEMQSMVERTIAGMADLNWWFILPGFLLYFLLGYFMYAALFAAVGSAMGDDMGESQSLTMPIIIPVILAFYIATAALQSPNSSLAVWSSIFPLFSPIVMSVRLPFGPPAWEVILSLVVAAVFTAALVWLAGRIYRIGILNYGKKGSFKDIGRWMFSKY